MLTATTYCGALDDASALEHVYLRSTIITIIRTITAITIIRTIPMITTIAIITITTIITMIKIVVIITIKIIILNNCYYYNFVVP